MPKWIGDRLENAVGTKVTVIDTLYITPKIKKIRFEGNLSKMDFILGGASVIRVSETEYRNYTIAYHNVEMGVLEIIFYIHGNGIGSQYIDTLKIDNELYISSARGRTVYNQKVKQYFFFGDETSLGLACSLQAVFKQNNQQFKFYFELDPQNKNIPKLLGLENQTVFSKNSLFRNEKRVSDLPLFKMLEWQAAHFILTGNVKSVQTFRKVLKNTFKGKVCSQGYWLEGKKGL
jgi:NADPH-dependent ferric siderophore reductase